MNMMKLAVIAALAVFNASGYAEEIKVKTVTENGRLVDDINIPFVADQAVLGKWVSVDFVRTPGAFTPGIQSFNGDLYLEGLNFLPNGRTAQPWWTWTKGILMHKGDRTAARYEIRQIDGQEYMFLEWKSGDYTIRHQTPQYYVLKKQLTNDGAGFILPSKN